MQPVVHSNQPDSPHVAYGQTTPNPTFDNNDGPAPAYAEIDAEPAYESAVVGRASVYDMGYLAGAKDHALRDKRLAKQQNGSDDDDDVDLDV